MEQRGGKSMKIFKSKLSDFYKWVKGTELVELDDIDVSEDPVCLLYTSPSPRDGLLSRMPSSA